jgi:hypothetical protein
MRAALRAATFLALVLVFPCPWYMFAVGGLLPLPVIMRYGLDGGITLAVSVVHLIVYTLLFFLAVRRIRRPVVAAGVIAGIAALSFMPIYGSGENLAAGGKLNRNAYQAYSDAFGV